MRALLLGLAAIALTGCGYGITSPMGPQAPVNPVSATATVPPDQAWTRIAQWIDSKGGHLTSSDKAAGMLWADVPLGITDRDARAFVNCGNGEGYARELTPTSQVQATISAATSGSTVAIAARFDNSAYYPEMYQPPWQCASTGKLEQEALTALAH